MHPMQLVTLPNDKHEKREGYTLYTWETWKEKTSKNVPSILQPYLTYNANIIYSKWYHIYSPWSKTCLWNEMGKKLGKNKRFSLNGMIKQAKRSQNYVQKLQQARRRSAGWQPQTDLLSSAKIVTSPLNKICKFKDMLSTTI